ncbi:MAG: hypothetical protein ACLFUV_09445 [Methanomassiliicoccales archaeon]
MQLGIPILLIAWFAVGGVVAVHMHTEMKARRRMNRPWLAIGFLLNLIGLLVYRLAVKIERRHPYQYPPPPSYENPRYEFRGREEPVYQEEEQVQQRTDPVFRPVEGIPRCNHCGSAISSHDWDCPMCGSGLRY